MNGNDDGSNYSVKDEDLSPARKLYHATSAKAVITSSRRSSSTSVASAMTTTTSASSSSPSLGKAKIIASASAAGEAAPPCIASSPFKRLKVEQQPQKQPPEAWDKNHLPKLCERDEQHYRLTSTLMSSSSMSSSASSSASGNGNSNCGSKTMAVNGPESNTSNPLTQLRRKTEEQEGNEREDIDDEEIDADSDHSGSTSSRENGHDVVRRVGDDDDETNSDDELALQQIMAAVARGRIPVEFLAQLQQWQQEQHHDNDDDDDEEPEILPYPPPQSLADVARFIQSDQCQNIIILAGAGMSVASGIPDFRSPNGLYATLNADLLTCDDQSQRDKIHADPSYALDQHLFLENPLPCLEVNRDFILGIHEQRWKATLAHRFVELLHSKSGKLCRLYTQNIDGLEDQCHLLPHSKIIAVHGSMDEAACAKCSAIMPMDQFSHEMKTKIKDWTKGIPSRTKEDDDDEEDGHSISSSSKESSSSSSTNTDATPTSTAIPPSTSTPIYCPQCGAPTVKPNIVLFRSPLPQVFFQHCHQDTSQADLLLVLGTSLGVAPANSLVYKVPSTCMRVLLNRELVGWHLGFDPRPNGRGRSRRDFFAKGTCEELCLELLRHLGWLDDLKLLVFSQSNGSSDGDNDDDDDDDDDDRTSAKILLLPESSQAMLMKALTEEADQRST
jgi:NAD-dependent SIR2 family protein deacetylase